MNGIIFKMLLDSKNIYVSSSSACSENLLMQSHVLKAIGLTDEECDSTIRFTFSKHTSVREINYVTSEIINYFYDIAFVKIIIGIGRRIDNVQIRYPILVDFFMIIYSKPSINPSKAAISVINIEKFID
ncbi:hypothetical protein [Clostridium sp.]|uniref:hypothetical protein n=1 Tax=Clostridium sp. TaxID=1506 RepID=UPI003216343A